MADHLLGAVLADRRRRGDSARHRLWGDSADHRLRGDSAEEHLPQEVTADLVLRPSRGMVPMTDHRPLLVAVEGDSAELRPLLEGDLEGRLPRAASVGRSRPQQEVVVAGRPRCGQSLAPLCRRLSGGHHLLLVEAEEVVVVVRRG